MNNFFKRTLTVIVTVATVITATLTFMPQTYVDVYAMSRKTAKSRITKLDKDIKKLKASLPKDRIQDAKDAEAVFRLTGFIQSPEPLVVSDSGTGKLLYFESDNGLQRNGLYLNGYYRLTNQYITANGSVVQVALPAELPHAAADTQAKLDADIKERDELKKAVSDTVIIDDVTVKKGESVPLTIRWKYGTPSYNTFKYKAKKSGIATISSDGTVKGKKKGKTTFTATMSASGKKVTFSVRVV